MKILHIRERITRFLPLILVAVTCWTHNVHAEPAANETILIGGGYKLGGSQGQIELNVKWVQQILGEANTNLHVFYSDGHAPEPDVYAINPAQPEKARLEPLARVFSSVEQNNTEYFNNSVPDVIDSTEASSLAPQLESLVSNAAGDVLLVYNGHGAPSTGPRSSVALKLWNDTRMSASDLHPIVDKLPPDSTFRYVFTQCYSGGFHQLMYDHPSKQQLTDKLPDKAKSCGFTAESAYRLSEGCSASLKLADYRDYTTFFFAALNGSDRLGQALTSQPDTNNNGKVSFREAHLHTLQHAISTDLSRSSSEQYLEDWQPWYLRWNSSDGLFGNTDLEDNEYTRLYHSIMQSNALQGQSHKGLAAIRSELQKRKQKLSELQSARWQQRQNSERSRQTILKKLLAKWPVLAAPYTTDFQRLMQSELEPILSWISQHKDYPELRRLQMQDTTLVGEILQHERSVAQGYKALRMRKLSRLKTQIYSYGSARQVGFYEQLLQCEEGHLN